jgi:capsular exopolysaccharide synthesis family protein
MRKPSIHKVFLKTNMKGLSTIISGQTSIESTVQPTLVNHLSILTSGPIPPNPSEILGSQRMVTLLQDLKKQFDIIIIDTPPALAVTDAQLLSTKCDGVLLVIKHGKVKQEHAVKVKAMFDYVQVKIFGVVINNISRKTAESYNYYYYYKYYGSKVDEGKDV